MSVIEVHYRANRNRLVNRYSFLGGSAEDVVHDAYERAMRYYSSFTGEDFNKWFSTILRNAMRDHLKAEQGRGDEVEIDEYEHVGNYCSGFTDKMWEEIFSRINQKKPDQAELLNLYFNYGYSYRDIAAVTDYTYFAAYRAVTRFKKELKKDFKWNDF